MNYQKELEKILDTININDKPSLLLHACCGPCSSYVLEYLTKYFEITIYYYNPNIYPKEEYSRRLNELKKFVIDSNSNVNVIEELYNEEDYDKSVWGLEHLGEKSIRCYKCYEFRMNKAAIYAKENKYDYFTTTLSISPHKNSKWINEIGEHLQDKYDINYLYADFKKKDGYKRSLELSKKYNLYRQDYCGCKYSKKERLGE